MKARDVMNYDQFNQDTDTATFAPGTYIGFFHGSEGLTRPDMDDWGFAGPVIGPVSFIHETYSCHTRIAVSPVVALRFPMLEWHDYGEYVMYEFFHDDCAAVDGDLYGDWSIFVWPRPHVEQELNTKITYTYRDASGYQADETVILKGGETFSFLKNFLIDGEFFVPSDCGLEDLQSRLGPRNADDHDWHAIHEDDVSWTLQPATTEMTIGQFASRLIRSKNSQGGGI